MSRRTKSQPEAVGSLVGRVLEDLGAGEVAQVMRIAQRWQEALGEEIASHCRPTALRGSVLETTADSSAWCQQLQLRKPEILASLRSALGDDAPSDLWLRVGTPREWAR